MTSSSTASVATLSTTTETTSTSLSAISYEEKLKLKMDICNMPSYYVQPIIQILTKYCNCTDTVDREVDLGELPDFIIRALQQYVIDSAMFDTIVDAQMRFETENKDEITYDEKVQLKADVFRLPSTALLPIAQIVTSSNDTVGDNVDKLLDNDDFEIDLLKLDTTVLRQLQHYVRSVDVTQTASTTTTSIQPTVTTATIIINNRICS